MSTPKRFGVVIDQEKVEQMACPYCWGTSCFDGMDSSQSAAVAGSR